jgi:hypothetical protein
MSKYLDIFPKVYYTLSDSTYTTNYDVVTNLTFRFGFIKEILNNSSAFYEYVIPDSERPETLAEKVYGDPEAHWVLLLANDKYDPQYDWPLNYRDFKNYIIGKYGSIANAKTATHHYEKVVVRTEEKTGISNTFRYIVDYEPLANNNIQVPYDYYTDLAATQSVSTYEIGGKTITEIIYGEEIKVYDYEESMNEQKRNIKLMKPEYYQTILNEFYKLTNSERSLFPFLRSPN